MNLLSLYFNPLPIFAEIPDYKAGEALEILKNSSTIANELSESFQTLWDGIILEDVWKVKQECDRFDKIKGVGK